MASRISGCASRWAAGVAAGCGTAEGETAGVVGDLGDAVVVVTDAQSARARTTRLERLRIFNFIFRSMTIKIISAAPELAGDGIILILDGQS